MLGKEATVANDAKEFDVRSRSSNEKNFNCVGPRPPLPCYCGGGPRPGPRRESQPRGFAGLKA